MMSHYQSLRASTLLSYLRVHRHWIHKTTRCCKSQTLSFASQSSYWSEIPNCFKLSVRVLTTVITTWLCLIGFLIKSYLDKPAAVFCIWVLYWLKFSASGAREWPECNLDKCPLTDNDRSVSLSLFLWMYYFGKSFVTRWLFVTLMCSPINKFASKTCM